MDRSTRWDGDHIRGGIAELTKLREVSNALDEEAKRLFRIEQDYPSEWDNKGPLIGSGQTTASPRFTGGRREIDHLAIAHEADYLAASDSNC